MKNGSFGTLFNAGIPDSMAPVLNDVMHERIRQDQKWGEQNHRDGTSAYFEDERDQVRELCDEVFARGEGSWAWILKEECWEAFAEEDPDKLRAELAQVAAVAVAWIECIDRREANG